MNQIIDWLVGLMETIGAPGAGLAVALENLFPPIPSEAILPLAGFTAARGGMGLIDAIVWTTAGSLVGALTLYAIGAAVGLDRIRKIVDKLPLVDVSDLDKTVNWFNKHGMKAVFFGRMIPIFRSLISIPAGVTRMPLVPFCLLTTLGSALWNTIFIVAGYYLGANWAIVEEYAGVFQKVVIVAVVIALTIWVVRKVRSRKAKQTPVAADEETSQTEPR